MFLQQRVWFIYSAGGRGAKYAVLNVGALAYVLFARDQVLRLQHLAWFDEPRNQFPEHLKQRPYAQRSRETEKYCTRFMQEARDTSQHEHGRNPRQAAKSFNMDQACEYNATLNMAQLNKDEREANIVGYPWKMALRQPNQVPVAGTPHQQQKRPAAAAVGRTTRPCPPWRRG